MPLLAKGKKVLFILQVQVEAENLKDAINKMPEGVDVLSGSARPQTQPAAGGVQRTVTGSQFAQSTQPR